MRSGMSQFWKTIWGLNVPNPVNISLWRTCNNILTTKDNVQKRGMVTKFLCIFCMSNCEQSNISYVIAYWLMMYGVPMGEKYKRALGKDVLS